MDWSIQEIARLASTTSRTLRHYGDLGLLPPSRIGANGYRYYDAAALVRLQRILMLRALGLGLPAIREVLDHETDAARALGAHLAWLRGERDRLDRQIGSVEDTITTLNRKEQLMAENMFDGFDPTEHREEVEQRWGAAAWANGDAWWRGMSAAEKAAWQERQAQLLADWRAAAAFSGASGASGRLDPAGAEAQALAQRQFDWLRAIPGTPGGGPGGAGPSKEYFTGLGEMYVSDERFAANYGGPAGAAFVRAALLAYADRNL
ncbi:MULTISPECIES: MerR family transcriptional regulator [unclassified Cryobacterium]|uniref:MerR family transcriptional regulator n=1 Tax=unclassified Cryobacterium TaxID=2649013 RepID=UPI00106B099A|nr:MULTISPECIES: MerR family transcriptional regulator [unclassified Cryobacterium]TFB93733.1 MerR family transcriptional regulator [Cryobacterium sp. MDB2-A-1]TFC09055.1 MerR family transcriptional regulator [Cryobacterium sp. MDB2-33-2]TFC14299.1 MerR family transcriptional regulator [Cryobacterium sp. MDB2-10]TFC14835.1 MerR family transcriptional regulator [Cryobacterium sp. MDB2-A-2]